MTIQSACGGVKELLDGFYLYNVMVENGDYKAMIMSIITRSCMSKFEILFLLQNHPEIRDPLWIKVLYI